MKKVLYALLILLVIIQFIRPGRNHSGGMGENDITHKYTIPANVQDLLKNSCYDCHSNNTNYPWYTNIQPVGWWMQNHVNEGKDELNFSEFAAYQPKRARHKMKEVAEQVEGGEMPLNSYTWIHKDAILNAEQKQAVIDWAHALENEIATTNNLPPEEPRPKRPE